VREAAPDRVFVSKNRPLQGTLARMQCHHALATGFIDHRSVRPGSIFDAAPRPDRAYARDIRERMRIRQRMIQAQGELHRPADDDEDRIFMPPRGLVFYASPEPFAI